MKEMKGVSMHRAEQFIEDIGDHILKLMEEEVHNLKPTELNYIVAMCDLHNQACEFVELKEKFDKREGKHISEWPSFSNPERHKR